MTRSWKRAVIGAAAVAGLAGGCATSKSASAPEIKDDWVARVPPEQMGPVNDARDSKRKAEDDVARAEVAVKDAKNELDVAKNRHAAQKKMGDAERAALKAAQDRGDPQALTSATQRTQRAELQEKVQKAVVDFGQQRVEAREAALDLAKAELKLKENTLARVEYEALSARKDTRVQDVDPQSFVAATQQREADIAQRKAKLNQEESELRTARENWQRLNEQLQAAGEATTPAG
jgi:colicin import membrane protein